MTEHKKAAATAVNDDGGMLDILMAGMAINIETERLGNLSTDTDFQQFFVKIWLKLGTLTINSGRN
jgi:hypothetical protein